MQETPLLTEQAAKRDLNLASNRRWGVFNPSVTNALGQPAGYVLVPGDNSVPYRGAGEANETRRRRRDERA
jgi:primary-amine oxidase